jgi:hypothetical protein
MLTDDMLALVATVLIPIPDTDFDPTEVAVSWQVLTGDGHTVVFSTQSGVQAAADDIMLTGRGLDFWSKVPGLNRVTVVGRILRANRDARGGCGRLVASRRALCAGDAQLYRQRRVAATRL